MSKKSPPSPPLNKTVKKPVKKGSAFSLDPLRKLIESKEGIIVLYLTLFALALRLFRLNHLSFWVDEYMHVNRAVDFLKDFHFSHLFAGEKNGLLVTLLNVVGFGLFGKNEFGGRVFIALLGTALVPVIYYFCKTLFNRPVALMSAILVVFSQYLVYWSRLDRQYGPIPTIYLLLILASVLYVQKNFPKETRFNLFRKITIDLGSLGFLVFIGLLAFATNFISYFIAFSFGIYSILLWIAGTGNPTEVAGKKNYRVIIISACSLLFFILTFSPLNALLLKPVFQKLMPENMVNLILPNFTYIKSKLISAEKFNCFKVYWGVITTDLPHMIYFAIAGMVTLAAVDFRKFIILFAYYIPPFLLMSFVFMDPCLPRYHTFIYPLFIIATTCAFYYIPAALSNRFAPGNMATRDRAYTFSMVVFVVMMMASKALTNPIKVINTDNHGAPIDRKLSIWYFTNWKEPSLYIKKNIKKGDLVFSTVPDAVNFYINQKDNYQVNLFRQLRLNPETRDFVQIGSSDKLPSATSTTDLYKTMETYPRIWLIADYYLYNTLTDPNTRELVFKNFTLFPEACRDGSVQLFLWDRNNTGKFQHNTLLELGKPVGRQISPGFGYTFSQQHLDKGVKVTILSTGIDSDKEAFLFVNNKDHFNIPKPNRMVQGNLGQSEIIIPGNKLVLGKNSIYVKYNATKPDPYKGFIVYNLVVE